MPGYTMHFPQDEGSHPRFRTEWWYVTGWLRDANNKPLGFQITFFRTRPDIAADDNPSAFAPHQILLAHAALSDPAVGHLLHDQRVERAGFGLVGAATGRTDVHIDDWSLKQEGRRYVARIPAQDFTLNLVIDATQPPLLNGDHGYSRKGPAAASASYYYSIPQLKVSGTVVRNGHTERITGNAWLDHEWSSSYVPQGAVGWDWIGINFANGGALMAFRMRGPGGKSLWSGGTWRNASGGTHALKPSDIDFTPLRKWRSPRTGTAYPVAWHIRAGTLEFTIEPLMDDQENDARATAGTIYWEGAVRALKNGKPLGEGYLELTGYWRPLDL
ncbi:MAG TPA: lipocalin-like domain-containing protein [Burkholderiales bacterium]|nr:lipocalin-like domain-containing protein [Burkholderiales bacterium]